jgi:hypothetical protein
MRSEADPIEFNAFSHFRVDAVEMDAETDNPWVQLCITGDDGESLNLNLDGEYAIMLMRELQEM